MAELLSNVPLSPSNGNSAPSSPDTTPNLSQEVRSKMPGLEGAIEVAPTQARGGNGDNAKAQQKSAAPLKQEHIKEAAPAMEEDVTSLSDEVLLRDTRRKIKSLFANLEGKAEQIKRSSSPSKASNFARIVANMRQLNISLSSLYRMSLDKVRELYKQLR